MARGIRYFKSKTVVNLSALELFLDQFDTDMIDTLIDLCEFAATHPDFGKPGYPGSDDWLSADEATDHLVGLFMHEHECSDDPEDAPRVVLNYQAGTLALLKRRPRRPKAPREPLVEDATADVPVRLFRRAHSTN